MDLGQLRFAFVDPEAGHPGRGNNASCVLRVTAPGGSMPLTGEIERGAEKALIARHEPVRADIVVAPDEELGAVPGEL